MPLFQSDLQSLPHKTIPFYILYVKIINNHARKERLSVLM
ncbi:hypothetical protein CHCC14809_0313 [Bacillus licheniformis]|nr:hypothetical protein CHCC15087_4339 [Bacillus licheniformis]TWM82575.1 hypothetical protein CHCC14809_0313 [Bacillus licheniformis]TWM86520.1 hypothetical protein CHCC14600_4198 [Bacillus licheniformis]TWM96631.1 hypothetical protein CHCC14596_3269 [Bacillus licheniformis]TWN34365.1 hypothetical protein CHCC14525_2508 [Bacillus licheniformis]